MLAMGTNPQKYRLSDSNLSGGFEYPQPPLPPAEGIHFVRPQ